MANKIQKQITTHQETPMNKKIRNDDFHSNSLVLLPHDIIIYDILTRLPLESLIRFKCVCKLWYNLLLNDSRFIKLRSLRNHPNSSPGFIWLSSNYTEDYDDLDKSRGVTKCNGIVFYDIEKRLERFFHFRSDTGLVNKKFVTIQHSLNGFVLLSCQENRNYCHYVYNPVTGFSIKVPVLGKISRRKNGYNLHLAYDSVTEKYKVVCFCFGVLKKEYFFKIVTLGVENDSWRDVDVPESYPRLRDDDYSAVFANGSLNWCTHVRYGGFSSVDQRDQRKLLSIDVSSETFYTITYPKGALNNCKLLEIEGSLCFFDRGSIGALQLWVLKVDEEKQKKNQPLQYEWIEKCKVDMGHTALYSFDSYEFVRIVTNPSLKIIFWVDERWDKNEEEDSDSDQVINYYSYDAALKTMTRLRSICQQTSISCGI
ncbi:hypothetical protein MKW94_005215 [Papaver nudicaule]|uniref:F-box domain-containing protein n=1 Tax=Papaver nudicaule TaxID=74823 RepID=A0AA41RX14_PAPNU|nr:hypothetical protein [Papaver nudicaule]